MTSDPYLQAKKIQREEGGDLNHILEERFGILLCRVCGGFIDQEQKFIKRGDTYEHLDSQGPECNRYANYYGPSKPID